MILKYTKFGKEYRHNSQHF